MLSKIISNLIEQDNENNKYNGGQEQRNFRENLIHLIILCKETDIKVFNEPEFQAEFFVNVTDMILSFNEMIKVEILSEIDDKLKNFSSELIEKMSNAFGFQNRNNRGSWY